MLRDEDEIRESRAEDRAERLNCDGERIDCANGCGARISISAGNYMSPDPYAMPVCDDCAEEIEEQRAQWSARRGDN
jgi:hypothetical protein